MNDYIKMEKLWYDNELIQLEVICSSSVITATAKIYVSNLLIDDLIYKINLFLDNHQDKIVWSNDDKGDHSALCLELSFLKKDNLGHILIETFMELDDGGKYSSHNCCFYINTEMGLLKTFCDRLEQLKYMPIGANILLNDL